MWKQSGDPKFDQSQMESYLKLLSREYR